MPATGYIGKLQIDSGDILPIGSTLFGVCHTPAATAAKVVENTALSPDALGAAFSPLLDGVTVHIQFENGNTVAAGLTLKIADTTAKTISNPGGSCMWAAGAVVSFTYDGTYWVCNDSTSTAIPIENTYDGTNTNAISGKGVKAALETLDVSNITSNLGTDKTITALSETDGKIAATASPIAITKSQVTDFPALGDAAEKDTVTDIVDSGANANNDNTTVPTTRAVASYVANKTAGLTGAMHFKGEVQSLPDATTSTTFNTYEAGDVILFGDKEYVYNKGQSAATSEWILLGDEGSYVLKTSQTTGSVGSASGWSAGTTPTLGEAIPADDITNWSAGTLPTLGTAIAADEITNWDDGDTATFEVTSGVLRITSGTKPSLSHTAKSIPNVTAVGTLPTLNYTAKSIPNITGVGTAPTLTITNTNVIVPAST